MAPSTWQRPGLRAALLYAFAAGLLGAVVSAVAFSLIMVLSTEPADRAKAMGVFEKAGRGELATAIAQESRQAVIELVAAGAVKAKEGDYRGAVALMVEAVNKLPDNPQVVFNAAVAVLKCLENMGWDERLGQYSLSLIDTVRRLDPINPKLPALAGLHQQILKKYDKGPRVKKA